MEKIKINDKILSYRFSHYKAYGLTLENYMFPDDVLASNLNLSFEIYKKILIDNAAICISDQYYFKTEKDIKNCIKYLINYLLSERLKGSSLKIEYIEEME